MIEPRTCSIHSTTDLYLPLTPLWFCYFSAGKPSMVSIIFHMLEPTFIPVMSTSLYKNPYNWRKKHKRSTYYSTPKSPYRISIFSLSSEVNLLRFEAVWPWASSMTPLCPYLDFFPYSSSSIKQVIDSKTYSYAW